MKISHVQVEYYLKSISFPAINQDIIQQAGIMVQITSFKYSGHSVDKEYNSPIDISKAIGKMK